jgi:outer membrane immunogenic protein
MRIKVAVLVALAAALDASSAFSDDVNFGAPAALTAPPASFGGVEFGLDLGGAAGATGPYTTSGFAGGGHVGYNFQSGAFVGGVEADLLLSSIGGSYAIATDTLDSLRARAGYAFGPFLAYGVIGGAYSNMTYSNAAASFNTSLGGYVFGLGGEYAFMPNISVRGELRRYIMGDAFYSLPSGPQTLSTSQTLFLVGVSGHF